MLNIRPRLTALNEVQIDKVHGDVLKVLQETGVAVDDARARKLFEKAIGTSFKDHYIRIPKELVQWAINAAPRQIDIYDRKGTASFTLNGQGRQQTVFGIGVTNLHYQDPFDGKILPFSRRHMSAATGLGHMLESYDFISTPGVVQDMPSRTADQYGLLEMIAHTTKPIVMLISDWDGFVPALEFFEHLVPEVFEKPCVIPYVNPITPLVLNSETTQKMTAAIQRGLPVIFSNYGMSGATCPITPAGTLVVLTAELLAGLVYSQLVKEGTPIILGSLPAAFDMKHAGSFYSPHTLLLNVACADMMAYYGIPHCGTSGSSDGWGADLLSSITLCTNHITSVLGKVGMAPFVGGCFDSLVFSPELVVYADDVIRQSRRFAEGFSLEDAMVGFNDIVHTGPGGDYLMSDLTIKYFKDSGFSSHVWPHTSLDKWREKGEMTAEKVLQEHTCDMLSCLELPDDCPEILSKGEAYLKLSGWSK